MHANKCTVKDVITVVKSLKSGGQLGPLSNVEIWTQLCVVGRVVNLCEICKWKYFSLSRFFFISFMWIPVKSKKPSSALATALQSPFRLLSAVVTLCPTWDTFFSLFSIIYSSVGPWYCYLQYREASRFWWSVDLHLLWLFSLSQIKYRL